MLMVSKNPSSPKIHLEIEDQVITSRLVSFVGLVAAGYTAGIAVGYISASLKHLRLVPHWTRSRANKSIQELSSLRNPAKEGERSVGCRIRAFRR